MKPEIQISEPKDGVQEVTVTLLGFKIHFNIGEVPEGKGGEPLSSAVISLSDCCNDHSPIAIVFADPEDEEEFIHMQLQNPWGGEFIARISATHKQCQEKAGVS